jgi:hypothetical protein
LEDRLVWASYLLFLAKCVEWSEYFESEELELSEPDESLEIKIKLTSVRKKFDFTHLDEDTDESDE